MEENLGPLFRQSTTTSPLSFVSLSSGSCGNCGLLTYKDTSILIDAGVGIRKFLQVIRDEAIDISKVKAILITHDHADHTRSAVRLAHKYQWRIYAAPYVARALLYHRYASPELSAYLKSVEVGSTIEIGAMQIRSFEVPHDATQNVGYAIDTPQGRFTLITDIGEVTPTIITEIQSAKYLVFESNYDRELLQTGPYPYILKARISGGEGHISNEEAANTLAQHLTSTTKFLALCHLSGHNNRPDLALQTLQDTIRNYKREEELLTGTLQITILKRNECSPIFQLL